MEMTALATPTAFDSTTPGATAATLCEAFMRSAERFGDRPAIRTHPSGTELTWSEYQARVGRIAAGLAALGVGRGDTVGLLTPNVAEFSLLDTAVLFLGATPFSMYNTSPPHELQYVLGNAGCEVVVCSQKYRGLIEASQHSLRNVVVLEADAEDELTLERLEAMGDTGFDLDAAAAAVQPDDIATLIYTSGTTGRPKGVQLSHDNLMSHMRCIAGVLPVRPGGRCVSYLPLAHIADRLTGHYLQLFAGSTLTFIPDAAHSVSALQGIRPTHWGAVPRVWEKIMASFQARGIIDPAALAPDARAALVGELGLGEADFLTAGAAPIAGDVLEFFQKLGLTICECWGLSETCALVTVNPPRAVRVGTVGLPFAGVELKLLDDGEILVRGPQVMVGYRNDPDTTAEAIDPEGWLHTGDVGVFDEEGYLTIVDRKKELIISSSGKNMSPSHIERELKTSSAVIGQACVVGEARPYNTALLVLDPDVARALARDEGVPDTDVSDLAESPVIQEIVARAVEDANTRLSRPEQIKRYTLLGAEWLPGGEELTPTMKLRRVTIADRYAAEISDMYQPLKSRDG